MVNVNPMSRFFAMLPLRAPAPRPTPRLPWEIQVAVKSVYKADGGVIKPKKDAESFTPNRTTYQQEFELLRAVNEQQHHQPSLHNKKNWQDDNSNVIRVIQAATTAHLNPLLSLAVSPSLPPSFPIFPLTVESPCTINHLAIPLHAGIRRAPRRP